MAGSLHEFAVEVDRLLARLEHERALSLASLGAHRPGERQPKRSRRPLRVVWRGAERCGFSRAALSTEAVDRLRLVKLASMTRPSGASLSWRSSQLTRVDGRPSPGASMITLVMTFRVRRSAWTTSGPTASGTRIAASSVPALSQCCAVGFEPHRSRLLARPHRSHVAPEVLAQPEAEVLDELLPAVGDVTNLRIARAKRAVAGAVAYRHPVLAHVTEAAGTRALVVEVGDQLAEDPCLVRVGDAAVAVLDDRLGEDAPPREVDEATLRSLRRSTETGESVGAPVIWLEIVSTASRRFSRAMSR